MTAAAEQQLATKIDDLIERLQGVRALLIEERDAIASGAVAQIEDCNHLKQVALDAMNEALHSTLAQVERCGGTADIDGLGDLLRQAAEKDRGWRARQQRFTQVLQENQDLNQVNGYLAYTGQREASELLALILRDGAQDGGHLTYGASGKAETAGSGRGIRSRKA